MEEDKFADEPEMLSESWAARLQQCERDDSAESQYYRAIISRAEFAGYRVEVVSSSFGIVTVVKDRRLSLRVRLGRENLRPEIWQERMAALLVQSRLQHFVEDFSDVVRCWSGSVACEGLSAVSERERVARAVLADIFGIASAAALEVRIAVFPGATRLQVGYQTRVLATYIYNPVLAVVLEFRLHRLFPEPDGVDSAAQELNTNKSAPPALSAESFVPLLSLPQSVALFREYHDYLQPLGLDPSQINTIRDEINSSGCDALAGVVQIAENRELRVLGIAESSGSFADANSRLILDALPHLVWQGFTHLALDLPSLEEESLRCALAENQLQRFCLEMANRGRIGGGERLKKSANWIAIVNRAYELGLQIVGVEGLRDNCLEARVDRMAGILRESPLHRVLLLTSERILEEFAHCAGDWACSPGIVRTIGVVSSHGFDQVLRCILSGKSSDFSLRRAVVVDTAAAKTLGLLPRGLNNKTQYSAWDYVIIYPEGELSRFFQPI